VGDAAANYEPTESARIVHGLNSDVDIVNELAQRKRLDTGELGERAIRALDRRYLWAPAPSSRSVTPPTPSRPSPARRGPADRERPDRYSRIRRPGPQTRSACCSTTFTGTIRRPSGRPYVSDTRAIYRHSVHVAREDLDTDGTDEDRIRRQAQWISHSRQRKRQHPPGACPHAAAQPSNWPRHDPSWRRGLRQSVGPTRRIARGPAVDALPVDIRQSWRRKIARVRPSGRPPGVGVVRPS
jgi:hypothetical protein